MLRTKILILAVLFSGSLQVQAAIHDVIITRHGGSDYAIVDASSSDLYSVWIQIGGLPDIQLDLDPIYGASSSPDLLPLLPRTPALVKIGGFDLPVKSSVVLRQRNRGLFVPVYQSSRGIQFLFPIARPENGFVTLYIGNPSGGDATVTYRLGIMPSENLVVASGTVQQVSIAPEVLPAAALVGSNGVPVVLMLEFEARGKIVPMMIQPGG